MRNLNLNFLGALSKISLLAISLAMVVAIGVADYVTGYNLSLGLFYVAPISIVSWYVSRRAGIVLAGISAIVWYLVNSIYAPPNLAHAILIWNSAIRIGFFIIISFLLAALKKAYDRQNDLARTDQLTGLLTSHAFANEARLELARATRNKYRIAVLYIDLDNFKSYNDSRGHAAGDSLLRDIGLALKSSLRATDVAGRVGGDEFVIVLSAVSQMLAQATASRLQSAIHRVTLGQTPQVTATIGVVNSDGFDDIEALMVRADSMMFQGKATSKGSIQVEKRKDDA